MNLYKIYHVSRDMEQDYKIWQRCSPEPCQNYQWEYKFPFYLNKELVRGLEKNTLLNHSAKCTFPVVLQDPFESLMPQQLLLKCGAWGFFLLTSAKYSSHLSSKGIAGTQQMIIPSMLGLLFISSAQYNGCCKIRSQVEGWEVGATLTASFRLSSSTTLQYSTP